MKIRKPKRKLAKRLQRSMYAWGGVEKDLTDNYDYQARWNETFAGSTATGLASGAALGATIGGPWGAAIGGSIGMTAGAIAGAVMGDENSEKQQEMFAQAQKQRSTRRNEIETKLLEDFPSQGIEGASYNVAYGGNINPNNMRKKLSYQQGGQMTMAGQSPQGGFQQLASNVQEVQGASHEQGGVPLSRGAEVEGGEVVSNQMDGSKNIFSDRLAFSEGVSFADKAAQLGKKKSKHEEKMDSDSLFTKGTARRNIDKIEAELQKLFAMQEQMKQAMGIPSPEEQAAMEQQAMMQQQGMPQQGMEQGAPQQGMEQQGMPQQMVQQQMAQQMAQQGQQQGQFKMGGKLKYAVGGEVEPPKGEIVSPKPAKISKEQAFIDKYFPIIQAEITKLGVGVDARALTTQLGLESNWGRSGLTKNYNNFGGVKAVKGRGKTPPLETTEYFTEEYAKKWATREGNTILGFESDKTKGEGKNKKRHYKVKTPFSHFETIEEGIGRQVALVSNKNYSSHGSTRSLYDPEAYFKAVKAGGYATSLDYVQNNIDTYNNVKQYFPPIPAPVKVPELTENASIDADFKKYTEQAAQNIPVMQGDATAIQPISIPTQNQDMKPTYNPLSHANIQLAYGGQHKAKFNHGGKHKDKGKKKHKKRKSKFSGHFGLENSALHGTAQYQINPQLAAYAQGSYNLAPLLQGYNSEPHGGVGLQYGVPNHPVTLRGQANVGGHGFSGGEAGLRYNLNRRNIPQVNPYLMATGGKLKYYHGGPHDNDFGLQNKNNKTGGGGMSMDANQAIGAASNLVGDFGNMLLTAGMAETPTPETYYAMPLPTTVSTTATENSMRNAARDTNKMHLQNTASAQSAKANMAQTTAMGQGQLNKVHQDRINQENQLKTANRMNQQQVTMMNTQAQAAYKQQNLMREGTKRSEMSANLASVTGKVPQIMAEKNQMNKDLLEVQLLAKQYKDNGIWNRNLQKLFSDYYNGTITKEALDIGLTKTNKTVYEADRPNVLKLK